MLEKAVQKKYQVFITVWRYATFQDLRIQIMWIVMFFF